MGENVEFGVEGGDITSFEADVIVLKYAQDFYGADLAVAVRLERAGVSMEALRPPVNSYRYVDARGAVAARSALFLGVPSLWELGYEQIRLLAANSLAVLSREASSAKHVAMTIHGPGYGLDEVEALLAQLGGCLQSVEAGESPVDLVRISIVERNSARVERLRQALESALAHTKRVAHSSSRGSYRLISNTQQHTASGSTRPMDAIEQAGQESEGKPHAFVAMPFSGDMTDVFYYGIQRAVHANGLLCERVDQEAFTGEVMGRVRKRIEAARLVIAEVSGANPNVYLEVGYAWAKERPTILLVRDPKELRFDVAGHKCLCYDTIRQLEERLTEEIRNLKEHGTL